jgi:twitching motility protein PilT
MSQDILEPQGGGSEQAAAPLPFNMHQLLKLMVDKGASDLHITTASAPQIRIDGKLVPLKVNPLNGHDTRALCYSVLTDAQKATFEDRNELDFSFGIRNLARFRGNIFMQRGAVGGVFRIIPFQIRTFDELGLPAAVRRMAERPRGLILVTGPTGSGKSTTLAAIIDHINRTRHEHIITVEDPIEFVHPHKNCLVNQREVGVDTSGFKQALKYILRQDPDVVLVGELRDLETMEAALTIAETGHLVFATLHTNSCAQTINRVIDVFPPHQQDQVRAQLSMVLEGVVCQTLLPKLSGSGRAMALEIMVPTAAIRNLIREDKVHQIYSQMQLGQSEHGMTTLNQSLVDLYMRRVVSLEDALSRCSDVADFRRMVAAAQAAGGAPVRR